MSANTKAAVSEAESGSAPVPNPRTSSQKEEAGETAASCVGGAQSVDDLATASGVESEGTPSQPPSEHELLIERIGRTLAADKTMDSVFGPYEWSGHYNRWAEQLIATGLISDTPSDPAAFDDEDAGGPTAENHSEAPGAHGIRRECDSCGKRGTTIFSPAHNAHFCAECFKAETARLNQLGTSEPDDRKGPA